MITVPARFGPGQTFKVEAGGRRVRVRVPPGTRPGGQIQIEVEPLMGLPAWEDFDAWAREHVASAVEVFRQAQLSAAWATWPRLGRGKRD